MLMHVTTKMREDRARRALIKHGYVLRKTPARSWMRGYYEVGYSIIEIYHNIGVLGMTNRGYEASLKDVEEFVSELSAQ
jgi:hypothetical protein